MGGGLFDTCDTFHILYGRKIRWEFNLADFNLAILFLRAMMSYVIVTRRIRNPKALPSSNV